MVFKRKLLAALTAMALAATAVPFTAFADDDNAAEEAVIEEKTESAEESAVGLFDEASWTEVSDETALRGALPTTDNSTAYIKLTGDIALSSPIYVNAYWSDYDWCCYADENTDLTLYLDLNGNTLSYANYAAIVSGGTLVVTNSAETEEAVISGLDSGIYNLGNLEASDVTIYGGYYYYDADNGYGDYYGHGIYDDSAAGTTITLRNCKIGGPECSVNAYGSELKMTDCSEYSDLVTFNNDEHYFVSSQTKAEISNCTGGGVYAYGGLTISSSTVDSVTYAGKGSFNISGSTINNYLSYAPSASNGYKYPLTADCTVSNTVINGEVGYSGKYALYLKGYYSSTYGVEDSTITFTDCTVNDNDSVRAAFLALENVVLSGGTYGTIDFNGILSSTAYGEYAYGSMAVQDGAAVQTINVGYNATSSQQYKKYVGTITLTSGTLGTFNDYIADTSVWSNLSIGTDMQFTNCVSQVSTTTYDIVTDLNDYVENGALVKAEGSDYYKLDSNAEASSKVAYVLETNSNITQKGSLESGKSYPAGTALTVKVSKVTSPYIFEGWTVESGETETTYGTDDEAVTYDESAGSYTLELTLTEDTTVTPIVNDVFANATVVMPNGTTYEIDSVGDYLYMAKLSYYGETFSGKIIKVTADIDFDGADFYPIGALYKFQGTFDGNSKTISNVSYSTTGANAGIIAQAAGGAIIKDLTVKDSEFVCNPNGGHGGGIVGYVTGGSNTISGCSVKNVTLKGTGGSYSPYGGGIVGMISNTTENYDFIYNISVDNVVAFGNVVGRIDGKAKLDNVTVESGTKTAGSASLIGRVTDSYKEDSYNYSDVVISNINVNVSSLPLIGNMLKLSNAEGEVDPTVTITSGSEAVLGTGTITSNTVVASALVNTMGNTNSAEGASLTISDAGTSDDTYTIDSVVDTQNYAATLLIKSGTYSAEIKSYVAAGYYRYTEDSGDTTYVVGQTTNITYESSISADADSNVSFEDESITVNQDTTTTAIISGADTAVQEYAKNDTTAGGTVTYVHSDEVTYLDVTNETYENSTSYKSVTMDVTPYIIVKVDGEQTKKEELDLVGHTVTVRLPLPNDFFTVNEPVYVKHTHGSGTEILKGTVKTRTEGSTTYTYVDVTTDNGFSEFQLYESLLDVTDGISVVLAETETAGVYNINLVADTGAIYRFMSAQFEFGIDDDSIGYTIAPASDINLVTSADGDETVYGFYANDTNHGITNSTITIGTVTFAGVSDGFSFWVQGTDEYSETKVVAAIYNSSDNNLIRTFTEDGYISTDPTTGDLTIDNEPNTADESGDAILDNISLSLDETVLTINVMFPNVVSEQDADYTKMSLEYNNVMLTEAATVEIGGDTADYYGVIDDIPTAGDEWTGYSFTITVPTDYATTLKFTGDGYRTYRTTIVPTDEEAIVTIWNNAMDALTQVTVGCDGDSDATAKVTFLAGDICMNGTIDLYDLSAVVSYFGKTGLDADDTTYIQYDLNRDNKIDSKDIAMVLVSWGK